MRRACLLAAAIVLAARAAQADAGPTPSQLQAARELFAAAEKDEDAGRWGDALDKLRRVADVKATSGVRYHLALCEEKLGKLATAYAHYVEARDAATREGNAEVLGPTSDPFLPRLRARVPTLTLEVPAASATTVTVDGVPEPPGLWGVPVPIDPGSHRVEARGPSGVYARDLEVRERDVTVLAVTLVASRPSERPAAASAEAAGSPLPLLLAGSSLVLAGGGLAAFVLAPSDGRAAWRAAAVGAWIGAAGLATASIAVWTSQPRGDAGAVSVEVGPAALRVRAVF